MSTLITFLGTGRYETVTYTWQEHAAEPTNLFPIAAKQLFTPDKVIVLVTETAERYRPPKGEKCDKCNQVLPSPKENEGYAEKLKAALGNSVIFYRIPEGRSEAELWEIFDRVADSVEEKERVILDVTHAFRSIPLIVYAAAAYLRCTKKVTVERIIYGAYEAREPFRTPPQPEDRAPVFDLTPLLELVDWTNGAEALLKRGEASFIADRMIETHQTLRRTGTDKPERLKTLGEKLQELSRSLHLSRVREVMSTTNELVPLLKEARDEFQKWAKPFALIAEQIKHEFELLAFPKADELNLDNLEKQLKLVEYYLGKGLIVQGITLAREWVVSYVVFCSGKRNWLKVNVRKEAEEVLGAGISRKDRESHDSLPEWFTRLPQSTELVRLWNRLSDLRNDLAHCAMRENARTIDTIEKETKDIPEKLRELLNSICTIPSSNSSF